MVDCSHVSWHKWRQPWDASVTVSILCQVHKYQHRIVSCLRHRWMQQCTYITSISHFAVNVSVDEESIELMRTEKTVTVVQLQPTTQNCSQCHSVSCYSGVMWSVVVESSGCSMFIASLSKYHWLFWICKIVKSLIQWIYFSCKKTFSDLTKQEKHIINIMDWTLTVNRRHLPFSFFCFFLKPPVSAVISVS